MSAYKWALVFSHLLGTAIKLTVVGLVIFAAVRFAICHHVF